MTPLAHRTVLRSLGGSGATPDERRARRQETAASSRLGHPIGATRTCTITSACRFVAGRAGGAFKGGVHVKAQNGTPLANAMLTVVHALGLRDLRSFGDSTGTLDL